ncbi:MAG: XamI family restriction endonuclease [Bifidobacteriaceae bacterium]|jgi:hypothetical protein|nr:XamI family restriction endonuclease [Bifidobacteriaceae bacterium]
MISPPQWRPEQLASDRAKAIGLFRAQRATESVDTYLAFYQAAYQVFAEMMADTDNLRQAREMATAILTVKDRQDLARFIASPPLSADDLKTLADTSLSVGPLSRNPEAITSVIDLNMMSLDRRRFPWIPENRAPTPSEKETALVSTSVLFAIGKTETKRRAAGKRLELILKKHLDSVGLKEVPTAAITNATHGPAMGQYCGETSVVGTKADVVVRLFDGRLLLIECKVSNSETNSYKRLIHDCGEKAQTWVQMLGPANCSPAAVLMGCYSSLNLAQAQTMGLAVFWSHALDSLGEFISATK